MEDINQLLVDNSYLANAIRNYTNQLTEQSALELALALERSVNEDAIWLMPYADEDNGVGSFWDNKAGPDSRRFYYRMLESDKGSKMMAVFTDFDQVEKGPQTKVLASRAKTILTNFCTNPYTDLLLINPWEKNAVIDKEFIKYVLSRCELQ